MLNVKGVRPPPVFPSAQLSPWGHVGPRDGAGFHCLTAGGGLYSCRAKLPLRAVPTAWLGGKMGPILPLLLRSPAWALCLLTGCSYHCIQKASEWSYGAIVVVF